MTTSEQGGVVNDPLYVKYLRRSKGKMLRKEKGWLITTDV